MNDTGMPPVPAPGQVRANEKRTATPPRWLSTRRPAKVMERAAERSVSCGIGVVIPAGARPLHTIEEAPMLIFHKANYPTLPNR